MNQIITAISAFLLIFFSSCEKRVCEKNQTAQLIITNQTLQPIQFYFDGVYLYDMIELTTETLEVTVGTHSYGAKTESSTHLDTLKWLESSSFSVCELVEYTFEN